MTEEEVRKAYQEIFKEGLKTIQYLQGEERNRELRGMTADVYADGLAMSFCQRVFGVELTQKVFPPVRQLPPASVEARKRVRNIK